MWPEPRAHARESSLTPVTHLPRSLGSPRDVVTFLPGPQFPHLSQKEHSSLRGLMRMESEALKTLPEAFAVAGAPQARSCETKQWGVSRL